MLIKITKAQWNNNRLEKRILSKLPDWKAYHRGREAVLVFETDIGQAMITACQYTNGIYLAKAAEIIRKELSQHKIRFSGSLMKYQYRQLFQTHFLGLF